MAEIIYFNGRKYGSIAEMPSSERRKYEKINRIFADDNQDGLPDLFQISGFSELKDAFNTLKEFGQMGANEGMTGEQISIVRETQNGIFVNGKSFGSIHEMPSDIRKTYEDVVSSAQGGHAEIYEEEWRAVDRDDFFEPHDDEYLNPRISRRPSPVNPPIETVNSNSRFILLISVVILIFGILAMVWLMFF